MLTNLYSAVLVASLILIVVSIIGIGCTKNTAKPAETMIYHFVPEASSATQLLLSDNQRYMAAELGGEWQREEFDSTETVPPVVKVLQLQGERAITEQTIQGWPMGPPSNDGKLWYVAEEDRPNHYTVRHTNREDWSLGLSPPKGDWRFDVAFRSDTSGVIVLADRVYLNYSPSATTKRLHLTTVSLTTEKRNGHTVLDIPAAWGSSGGMAFNAARNELYFLVPPNKDTQPHWAVHAISIESLQQRWKLVLSPDVTSRSDATRLVMSGDDQKLVVLIGQDHRFFDVDTVVVIDTKTGQIESRTPIEKKSRLSWSNITKIVSVPNSPQIAFVHMRSSDPAIVVHGGTYVLDEVTFFDVQKSTRIGQHDYRDTKHAKEAPHLSTSTIAITRAGTRQTPGKILVAPSDYEWCYQHKLIKQAPTTGTGRNRPEVKGHVTTPKGWHQDTPLLPTKQE